MRPGPYLVGEKPVASRECVFKFEGEQDATSRDHVLGSYKKTTKDNEYVFISYLKISGRPRKHGSHMSPFVGAIRSLCPCLIWVLLSIPRAVYSKKTYEPVGCASGCSSQHSHGKLRAPGMAMYAEILDSQGFPISRSMGRYLLERALNYGTLF